MSTYYATGHHRHDRFIKQLDGSRYQGSNCTCASGAMCAYRHTHGRKVMSGATVRKYTYDTSGGTNLAQVEASLNRLGVNALYGPFYGMAMSQFYSLLRTTNRGAIVQGASIGTYGTKWSASSTFKGNHAWYVATAKGWARNSAGVYVPAYLLVYDPLADGRTAQPYPRTRSPFWLPRAYFEKFCRYLNIGGRLLGSGKVYVMFTKDTWYHVHLRSGATNMSGPHNLKVKGGYNIRRTPGGTSVAKTTAGNYFQAWQKVAGPEYGGSRTWYGSHKGDRWIHSSARA